MVKSWYPVNCLCWSNKSVVRGEELLGLSTNPLNVLCWKDKSVVRGGEIVRTWYQPIECFVLEEQYLLS
jgi:hypothetical protein